MSGTLSPLDGQVKDPEGVYPLNWDANLSSISSPTLLFSKTDQVSDAKIYPDFRVWKHTSNEDVIMNSHLQKGYFEPTFVTSECHSGRQVITQLLQKSSSQSQSALLSSSTLPSSSSSSSSDNNKNNNNNNTNNNSNSNNGNNNNNKNNGNGNETADNIYIAKMKALSGVLVKSMYRRKEINRIKSKSSYKPPPRVTLTEHKRETWLKNLANQKISLRQLARAIPHGLRNKILLEQCVNHRVPINRAIWLIKCVSSNEQRQLKRKATSVSSMVIVTNKWIIEWTEQITIFLEQVIENCFNSDSANKNWKFKLDYAISLIVNLYIEELMNRTTFLTWIVRFLSKIVKHQKVIVTDLKSLSVHYLLVKSFWFKIIKIDYLAKELSECMLYVIAKIHELPKNPLYDKIISKLNSVFQYLIKYLFYYNSDTFIIPSSWSYLKPHLKRVLDLKIGLVGDQFKLVTYRNESLMIDDSERSVSLNQPNKDKLQEHEYNLPRDKVSLIIHKLDNFKSGQIVDLTKLVFEDSNNTINNSEQTNWKKNFIIILEWCIQTTRTEKLGYQRISLVIFILQCKQAQLSQFKAKKYKQFKSEMELKITEFVYQMSEVLSFRDNITKKGSFYNLNYFLILINKLHTLKLFVVSSYLRRLIASGVIYLSEADRSCYIHLLILNSLPDLKDSNSKNILKRLGDSTGIQLQNLNVKKLKDLESKILNSIFDSDSSEIIYNDLYHLTQESFGYNLEDSFQIGQEVELGKFFINELVDRLNRNQKLLLNVSKLMALYRLCNNHFNKLSQLIRIIVEILEEEEPNIILADESALLLLLKLICFNSKLLSSTFYESTISVYEYCCQIINTWIIADNRYSISEVILKAKIPSLLLSDFKLNINTETNKLEYSNLTLENLAVLGVSSYGRLGNAAEFSHHLNIGITRYYNTIKGLEVENRPMIINFLKCLKNWKPVEFQDLLSNYLKKFIQPTLLLDYELNLKAILKLVIDDLMDMKTVFDVFNANSLVNDGFSSNSSERLLCDILFNTQLELDEYEYFLLCFERMIYKIDYEKDYFNSLTFVVKTPFRKTKELPTTEDVNMVGVDDVVSVDVINSFHQLTNVSQMETNQTEKSDDREEYEKRQNSEVVNALWDLITSHLEIFIEIFYETNNEGLNNHLLRNFFFTKILKISDFNNNPTDNNNFSEINEIIKNINYFNLPVCQWLFESIVAEEYSNIGDNAETTNKFLLLVDNVLVQMSELDNYNNNQIHDNMYLVGELFVFLSNKFKLKILAACEEHYLNSDNFPKVLVNGENMTNFLNNVISSCSRLSEDSSLKVELTDALVFSLNLSLEKLMYFCHNLEHHKKNIQTRVKSMQDLEAGVKLISKIILIHKTFLVELIMKRSVNLQRDVLLLNLTKLFNNRIMNKNPKLKNLLYDVLISIKVFISESISQQYQKNLSLSQNQTTSLIMNKSNSTSSFLALINSPKSQSNLNTERSIASPSVNNMLTNMPNILNIKAPNFNNNLRYLLSRFNIKDTIVEKNLRLYAIHENYDGSTGDDDNMLRFNYKKFELIEDSSPANSLNDSSISLQLFDCSISKQNPK